MEIEKVDLTAKGEVSDDAKEYARTKIARLGRLISWPVLYAKVKLTHENNPANERPATAEAILDINGRLVRAHVSAREMDEAIDLLDQRIRRQVEGLSHRDKSHNSFPEMWSSNTTELRPTYANLPPEERRVVTRKTYAPTSVTPDEAIFDMETLDYDFYLFTDVTTGRECIVYRLDDGGYGLCHDGEDSPLDAPVAAPIKEVFNSVPRITPETATERLDQTGEKFVFFVDERTGRGTVAYRRFDGHYGLITPD